jgi:6-pyruvoyl tetrahydropterin synthase
MTFNCPLLNIQSDCALLPVVHSTAEELAHYLFNKLVETFTPELLQQRGVLTMEVSVAEMPKQEAVYRQKIPQTIAGLVRNSPCASTPRPCLDCADCGS